MPDPNFCNVPDPFNRLDKARAVVIPAPFGKTVTYGTGTERGPRSVLEASSQLEYYDEEIGRETFRFGIYTAEFPPVSDLSSEQALSTLESIVTDVLEADRIPVLIGGEHSISIAPARAMKKYVENPSFVVLDAHADLRDEYMGSRLNHACTSRRISELGKTCILGVRSLSAEEVLLLEEEHIQVLFARDSCNGFDCNKVNDFLTNDVYISIDLDVFDPSLLPSVGTPEPGGPGWYEVLDLLKAVVSRKNVVGFDVVELAPNPQAPASDFITAKLIYRLLGYILSKKSSG